MNQILQLGGFFSLPRVASSSANPKASPAQSVFAVDGVSEQLCLALIVLTAILRGPSGADFGTQWAQEVLQE